jgi:DNA modification methylase
MNRGRCEVRHGHVLDMLQQIPEASVHCIVTSPPFWSLRDYHVEPVVWRGSGVRFDFDRCDHDWGNVVPGSNRGGSGTPTDKNNRGEAYGRNAERGAFCQRCGCWCGQLGLEPTPELYTAHLVDVFHEARRVLRDDGVLFLNLGDCYATGAGAVGEHPGGGKQGARWGGFRGDHAQDGKRDARAIPIGPMTQPNRMPLPGLKPKDLVGIPWRVAFALQGDGWWLRSWFPWVKRNCMPESVTDRPTVSIETFFILTKSENYYWDRFAIAKPCGMNRWSKDSDRDASVLGSVYQGQAGKTSLLRTGKDKNWFPEAGRNRRTGDWFFESLMIHKGVIISEAGEILGLDIPTESFNGAVFVADFVDENDVPRRRVPDCPQHADRGGPLFAGPGECVCPAVEVDHFACVDDETEILTLRGWKRHDRVAVGDILAGCDINSMTGIWQPCLAVHRYDYDGPLVAVESRDLSMRLTPTHRCVTQLMCTTTKRRCRPTMVEADKLTRYHFIPRDVKSTFSGRRIFGKRLAAVLGWVAAEGWYESNRIRISQSESANPDMVRKIDGLLPTARRSVRNRGRRGIEACWTLSPSDAAAVRRAMPQKLLPVEIIAASRVERVALFEAFVDGDGHRRRDGRVAIGQKRRRNLDILQAVAVTLGFKTSLRQRTDRWVLYVTDGGRSKTLRGTNGRASSIDRQPFRGKVWCPSTPSGTFLARRRGSVFVTGNSYPPALVEPLIKAGTSEYGCCAKCGAPWYRVVEGTGHVNRREPSHVPNNTPSKTDSTGWAPTTRATKRWRPSCKCDAATVPCRVLDPFGGSGATGVTATALGRDCILIDLNPDYCTMSEQRIAAEVR